MLVLLIGPDGVANERFGADLAEILGWPFHPARDARGMRSFIEEMARDVEHAAEVHGSCVSVGWHVASIVREAEARPLVAAATLTYARRGIDWYSVLVFPIGDADPRALALARALGAYVGKPVDPDDLFVAAPGLAWEVIEASKMLGLDDPTIGCGTA